MVGPGVCRAAVVAGGESNDLGGPRVVHYAYGITYNTITHIIANTFAHFIADTITDTITDIIPDHRPPPIHPNRNPHPDPYFFTNPSPYPDGPSLLCPSR